MGLPGLAICSSQSLNPIPALLAMIWPISPAYAQVDGMGKTLIEVWGPAGVIIVALAGVVVVLYRKREQELERYVALLEKTIVIAEKYETAAREMRELVMNHGKH